MTQKMKKTLSNHANPSAVTTTAQWLMRIQWRMTIVAKIIWDRNGGNQGALVNEDFLGNGL